MTPTASTAEPIFGATPFISSPRNLCSATAITPADFCCLIYSLGAGHCHNAYLEVALSLGVVGIAVMAAFTVRVFRVCLATKDLTLIGVACYCYCVSMLDPLLMTPGAPHGGAGGAAHDCRCQRARPIDRRRSWRPGPMRILLVHNHYQQPGGEDQVFAAEGKLLESFGHEGRPL